MSISSERLRQLALCVGDELAEGGVHRCDVTVEVGNAHACLSLLEQRAEPGFDVTLRLFCAKALADVID